MQGLTIRQQEILDYILDNKISIGPTFREIGDHFGITFNGAYDHVEALVKKGYLKKDSKGRIIFDG